MTQEKIIILIILYAFGIVIIIQSFRLWFAQRHIRYLVKKSTTTTSETPPIQPIMFDQNRSVPKAADANMPISTPPTMAPPIVYRALCIFKRFYQRGKHLVNHNRTEPEGKE